MDSIRGATLISMAAYHATWDLVYLFGVNWPWYDGLGAYLWQQSICWTFIFLSGFCWQFSRSPLKRGLTVFAAGAAISVVTLLFLQENRILFGILTLLGSCMLLMIPLERALRHVPAGVGLVCCFAFFAITRNVAEGYLGIGAWQLLRLPAPLYNSHFSTYLGFAMPGFFSVDYFPLLPWIFLFVAGYFTYRIFVRSGLLRRYCTTGLPFLNLWGRHSLLIYLLHQPAIYLALDTFL
ncbi:MAG: heparan-alpha-glucosaminide N-acetyltransferase [Intestinibacillus sp.]